MNKVVKERIDRLMQVASSQADYRVMLVNNGDYAEMMSSRKDDIKKCKVAIRPSSTVKVGKHSFI